MELHADLHDDSLRNTLWRRTIVSLAVFALSWTAAAAVFVADMSVAAPVVLLVIGGIGVTAAAKALALRDRLDGEHSDRRQLVANTAFLVAILAFFLTVGLLVLAVVLESAGHSADRAMPASGVSLCLFMFGILGFLWLDRNSEG